MKYDYFALKVFDVGILEEMCRAPYTVLSAPDVNSVKLFYLNWNFIYCIHFVFIHCFFSYFLFVCFTIPSNHVECGSAVQKQQQQQQHYADSKPCFYFSNTNIRWKMQIKKEFWKKSTGFTSQIKGILRRQRCYFYSFYHLTVVQTECFVCIDRQIRIMHRMSQFSLTQLSTAQRI